jgi:hypothetical protein
MVELSSGHGDHEALDCNVNIHFQSPLVMINHHRARTAKDEDDECNLSQGCRANGAWSAHLAPRSMR